MGEAYERRELNLALKFGVDPKAHSEILKAVGDHFRNDINAIWYRGQFYMLTNLGLLAFFSSTGFDRSGTPLVLIVSSAGIVISVAWLLILRMTILWIATWRHALVDTEAALVEFGPFKRGENLGGSAIQERNRPEFFAFVLSGVFIFIWIALFVLGAIGFFRNEPHRANSPMTGDVSRSVSANSFGMDFGYIHCIFYRGGTIQSAKEIKNFNPVFCREINDAKGIVCGGRDVSCATQKVSPDPGKKASTSESPSKIESCSHANGAVARTHRISNGSN